MNEEITEQVRKDMESEQVRKAEIIRLYEATGGVLRLIAQALPKQVTDKYIKKVLGEERPIIRFRDAVIRVLREEYEACSRDPEKLARRLSKRLQGCYLSDSSFMHYMKEAGLEVKADEPRGEVHDALPKKEERSLSAADLTRGHGRKIRRRGPEEYELSGLP